MPVLSPGIHVFMAGSKSPLTDVSIDAESGLQRVETIDQELFYSLATQVITISGTEPITPAGLATNAFNFIVDNATVLCQVACGPHMYVGEGLFQNANMSQGAGAVGTSKWTWEGKLTQI